jgi:hypothetical protein
MELGSKIEIPYRFPRLQSHRTALASGANLLYDKEEASADAAWGTMSLGGEAEFWIVALGNWEVLNL